MKTALVHILLNFLRSTSDRFEAIAGRLCVGLLFIMFFSVTLGIFFRYVLFYPLSWTEELARYAMIWLAFLSSGIAMKKGEHIGVEFFIERLPRILFQFVALVIKLLIAFFCYVVTVQGIPLVIFIQNTGQRTAALDLPTSIVYGAVPTGCIIMLVYLAPMILDNLICLFSIRGNTVDHGSENALGGG